MTGQLSLSIVLLLAGIGSAALVALAGLALYRRRSHSYLLVTIALGTLLVRTFLGGVTVGGLMSMQTHHVLEHVLDALVIGLLFAAVYAARSVDPAPDPNEPRHEESHD